MLVAGEWLTHELVGNRIGVNFQNGLSLEEQLSTAIGELRTFTPALSLQGFDLPLSHMEERSFLGNPFTLEGKVIHIAGEEAMINGNFILQKPNEELQKQVTNLEVAALPGLFPYVRLEVNATNAKGKLIEGLSASDFTIYDNKSPVKAILENNQRTPKILILYDISGSMLENFSDAGMDSFIDELEKAVLEKYPASNITKWPTDSGLYTWLKKASLTNNDLIIFATDGDNDDQYDSAMESIYRNGPPAIVLSVKDTSFESFDIMAEATNGLVLKASNKTKSIQEIMSFLGKLDIPPYVFTYYAAGMDIPHTVTLSIGDNRLVAEAAYEFTNKRTPDHPLGENIAGLYLTITHGDKTIRRVLAGWPEFENLPPTQQHFNEVRNLLLGGALISIEGEGPTLAAALSDDLKYKLSTRNWGEPLLRGDDQKAIEEFKKGGYHYNPLFNPLMAPLKDGITKDSFTYAAGPRIGILKQNLGINQKFSTLSFDYIPTSDFLSLDTAPLRAFNTTMTKTAQLAVLEKTYFQNSSLDLLHSKPLIELEEAKEMNWFRANEEVEKDPAFWERQLRLDNYGNKTTLYSPFTFFDKTASIKAYWQISHDTGELYGILPDRTGGGAQSIESQLNDIDKVVEAYGKILDHLAQGLSGALPIVAMYSKTLVKLYAIASVAIALMDASHVEKEVRQALIDMANEVAEHIADL